MIVNREENIVLILKQLVVIVLMIYHQTARYMLIFYKNYIYYISIKIFFKFKAMERVKCEIYTRVMGYFRPVSQFNVWKKQEYYDRINFKLDEKEWTQDNKN